MTFLIFITKFKKKIGSYVEETISYTKIHVWRTERLLSYVMLCVSLQLPFLQAFLLIDDMYSTCNNSSVELEKIYFTYE